MKDYYNILGIDKSATDEEIKKAYRKKALKYHPDVGGQDTESKFKEVAEAYEVLGDNKKRHQYDTYGRVGEPSGFSNSSDIEDIFSFFRNARYHKRSQRSHYESRKKTGKDTTIKAQINLEDLYFQKSLDIDIPWNDKCQTCNGLGSASKDKIQTCDKCSGSGFIENKGFIYDCFHCSGIGKIIDKEYECKTCNGKGLSQSNKNIKINFSTGATHGSVFSIKNHGMLRSPDGQRGNLKIIPIVKNHPLFQIDNTGFNIVYTCYIDLKTVMFSDSIEVPSLDEVINIKINKNKNFPQRFVVPQKGLLYSTNNRANMIIDVYLETPVCDNADIKISELNLETHFPKTQEQKNKADQYIKENTIHD